MKILRIIAFLGAFWALTAPVWAQTSCEVPEAEKKALWEKALETLHPYDACDGTFKECLEQKPPHPLVLRLARDLCRRVRSGKNLAELERGLWKRAQSVMPMGKQAAISLDPTQRAGVADAPVTIVCFACARCPFCKVIVPGLYEAVTKGPLKGKACLYYKIFPIKDHPGSTEGGLGLVSAARLGRFWPYTLKIYERFDSFCPKALSSWAEEEGMSREAFERHFQAKETRGSLVESKKEGLKYKVDSTPTLFIDGRKYAYEIGMDAIQDVVEEVYENRIRVR